MHYSKASNASSRSPILLKNTPMLIKLEIAVSMLIFMSFYMLYFIKW